MPVVAGLYYFAHGIEQTSRPPVILIHGAGGTHLYWPPQVRRMNGQRIYALDLPGHGKSGGVGKQFIQDYAQSVIDFMKAARLRAAVMVGHSMGSAIALWLALAHPRRVLGLGLIGAGARLRVTPAILESAASPATFLNAVKMVNDYSFGPSADAHLKELGAQRMAETRPAVLYGDFLACDGFDVMERLGEIKAPTLIMCGAEDRMTPPRYAETLKERIAGARLQIVAGAGHMLMLEQPTIVAEALAAFLNKVPYQPE